MAGLNQCTMTALACEPMDLDSTPSTETMMTFFLTVTRS